MTSKLLVIFFSASAGYILGRTVDTSGVQGLLSIVITALVFTTILPSMLLLRLRATRLARKPLIASLIINFIYSPIYALLAIKLAQNREMGIALASSLLMPVPSMNTVYVLMAGGDLELSVSLMAVNFLTGVATFPAMLSAVTGLHSIALDMRAVLRSLFVVIVMPVTLGNIAGRFYTPDREKISKFTEVSLNFLVFTIFFSKAGFVHPEYILGQIPLSLGFILTTILLAEVLSRVMRMSAREHMSYVFLTAGKNNSSVIAILTLSISPVYAVYVMIHQFTQIVTLFLYAKLRNGKILFKEVRSHSHEKS